MINWKCISINDKETIQHFYNMDHPRNCEFTFANNLLWSHFYDIKYAVIEETLVFLSQEKNISVTYPLGNGDIKKALHILMDFFKEQEKPFKMHLVDPMQFEQLDKWYPNEFQIQYDRDRADYIYESEKLRTLSGKKLHNKRNHINKFKENHTNWSYEVMTDENMDECIEMAKKWREINNCDENHEKRQEFCVTLNAIKLREQLGLMGGLLRLDGQVIAITLGEKCTNDTFVIHIEKAFANIQGSYPLINQLFVEQVASNYLYVNREEDTGSEGLRKAKLSYYPVFLQEKGIVSKK